MENRRNTVTKSIRLNKDVSDYLENEAKNSGISFEEYSERILISYKEIYSKYESVKPIGMYPVVLSSLLEFATDSELGEIGAIEASRFHKYALFVFNNRTIKDAIGYCLMDVLPSSGWFKCQISGNNYAITHELGDKWTKFLLSFLYSLIEIETEYKPSLELDGDGLIVKIDNK